MANSAIRLRAMLDFESESGEKRVAGDEWLFEGPGTAHLICNNNFSYFVIVEKIPSTYKQTTSCERGFLTFNLIKKKFQSLKEMLNLVPRVFSFFQDDG